MAAASSSMSDCNASSSDDELEDAPEFIVGKVAKASEKKGLSRDQSSKLDDLVSMIKEQTLEEKYLQNTKERLLTSIKRKANHEDEDTGMVSSDPFPESQCSEVQALQSELRVPLEKMGVNISIPKEEHPGLEVFNPDDMGCLFTELLTPLDCGFNPSSSVDELLAAVSPTKLSNILLSEAFLPLLRKLSQADSIKTWLFYIMSVHSSPNVSQFCYGNLMGLTQQSKVQSISPDTRKEQHWCPRASDLLKILVNYGASHDILLGNQMLYPPLEVSDHLTKLNGDTSCRLNSHLCKHNLSLVLNVLAACLQVRPKLPTQELNLMLHMLAKTFLDISFGSSLEREHQVCFSSILECYPNNEWHQVVPHLCRVLATVSDYHHDQARLAELISSNGRGEYLQIRLSYFFMHRLLCPEATQLTDEDLRDVELLDVTWLGKPIDRQNPSTLAVSLSELVSTDLYKMSSILLLIDLCVGNEQRRASKPRDHLEYLVDQVKSVIKGIRDSIYKEDQSKIKDALSRMKVKWTLTLRNRKSVQKSIFSWATSQQPIFQEKLQDQVITSDFDDFS